MFLSVFFPEKQFTTYRIKFFNVSKKIENSLSLQKPRACKTKSFLKAITLCSDLNQHVHLLSLFITCYKCFMRRKFGSTATTGKVKTFTDTVLGLL